MKEASSYLLFAFTLKLLFSRIVILSEAKDPLSRAPTKKQVLRFAQDDNIKMFVRTMCCEHLTTNDRRLLPKLLQEPHIALEEKLNIIHAVLQNRNPFHAHAEGKSRNFCRIVIYKPIHIRIDHAAAQQFNPTAGLAVAARSAVAHALAIAENATDLHVGARLGKRKERRIEARLHARSEQRFHGVVERALQIAARDVGIDCQTFNLVKDGRVRRVGRVVTVNFSRTHHAHRRLHLLHGANLHWRRVRAQQQAVAQWLRFLPGDEERVLRVARGMIRRKVQRFKVVIIRLNLRPFLDRVTQIAEDANDLVHRLEDGMFHADRTTNAGESDVKRPLNDTVWYSYL